MGNNFSFILGHNDDELPALGLMNQAYKAGNLKSIWITNGDSNTNEDREAESRNGIRHFGITEGLEFWHYSQIKLFDSIINREYNPFSEIYSRLEQEIIKSKPSSVYTCAFEGGNIIHDLLNYMVHGIINGINKFGSIKIIGYEFPQYHFENGRIIFGRFGKQNPVESEDIIQQYALSDEEFSRKLAATNEHFSQQDYFQQIKNIIGIGWEQFARIEVYRQMHHERDYTKKPVDIIYYELYGQEKIANGKYSSPITFNDFVKIIKFLKEKQKP